MIRLGVILGLAAGFIAVDAPGMSALGAMDSVAGNRGDPTDGDGPALRSNPLWAIPLSSLSATRERPLFSSSRRPPPVIAMAPPAPRVAPPPPPKAEEPDHPPLTIVGTVSSETGGIGVFLDQTTNTIIRLRTGENHAGWVLSAIQGREASFEKDHRTATLALPSRSAALSGQPVVPALAQAGATWTDGDGQQIAPPSAAMSQSAASPGPPLASASAMGQAGATTWTDGDGQEVTLPPGTMPQSMAALPGPHLASPSAEQVGATWTDGDGQQIAPPGRMSRSMAASPLTDSMRDQNVN
jgi:hypothetical protein